MRDTFIIRTEWFEALSELSIDDRDTIIQNLFHYHMDKENLINLNNLAVKLVWKLIEPGLSRNIDKYDRRKETSAKNGLLGGRPPLKKTEENNLNNLNKNLTKPNNHDSVSVSVSVSDSVLKENILKEKQNSFSDKKNEELILSDPNELKNCENNNIPQEVEKSRKTKKNSEKASFTPPSIEEVTEYCKKRGNSVDPEHFLAHYTANGWRQSNGLKIKDWRGAVITWEKNSKKNDNLSKHPSTVYKQNEMLNDGRF